MVLVTLAWVEAALGLVNRSAAGFAGMDVAVEGEAAERESLGELSTPGSLLDSFSFSGEMVFLLAGAT